MNAKRERLIVVVAGPNGAGKSTIAPALLRDALAVEEFVNADTIAAGLSALRPQSVAVAAGRVMLRRLDALARMQVDFAFETTLASRRLVPWLRTQQKAGYRVHLLFLSLPSADFAVLRVTGRVRSGGHDVPAADVRRRFARGLDNFFNRYLAIVDTWQLFDNSGASPLLIASGTRSERPRIVLRNMWDHLQELAS